MLDRTGNDTGLNSHDYNRLLLQVLMNIGLLWVTASVYQMMRGAEMIFAAALGIAFLKRKLNLWHLGCILCCMVRAPISFPCAYLLPLTRDCRRSLAMSFKVPRVSGLAFLHLLTFPQCLL